MFAVTLVEFKTMTGLELSSTIFCGVIGPDANWPVYCRQQAYNEVRAYSMGPGMVPGMGGQLFGPVSGFGGPFSGQYSGFVGVGILG